MSVGMHPGAKTALKTVLKTALGLDEADNAIQALAFFQIGHHKRPRTAHPPGIGIHLLQ